MRRAKGEGRGAEGSLSPSARVAVLSTFCLALSTSSLYAHDGGSVAGLWSGLLHPVTGLDHVLAMIAVGLWGAQMGNPAIWILPVVFPMVMAMGGMLALIGVPIPGAEIGVALSAVFLGLMVAGEVKPALAVAGVLVGFFAIFHGYAHGTELPEGQNGILYSVGFVASTGLLHATGIVIGLIHRWNWGRVMLRMAGGTVAASGVWFLVGALG